MTQQTLRAGELELVVDAARGGSIMAFRERGLRPDAALGRGRARIRAPTPASRWCRSPAASTMPASGFAGRDYQLAANFPPEPHAIHGDGWTSPWTDRRRRTRPAPSWSWSTTGPGDALRYRATQIFWLYPDRLEIAMSLTNRGPEPMPFGLGHHPYFGDRDQALLSAEVGGIWLPDDLNVPRQLEPVPVAVGFRLRRPVDELVLDHVFQGWGGKARHRLAGGWPGARDHRGRALSAIWSSTCRRARASSASSRSAWSATAST